jgi:hypothetical protein
MRTFKGSVDRCRCAAAANAFLIDAGTLPLFALLPFLSSMIIADANLQGQCRSLFFKDKFILGDVIANVT